MEKLRQELPNLLRIIIGCMLFAVGFDLFLVPSGLNAGGLTGLSMLIQRAFGSASVGTITAILNIPLFAIAGLRIGKRFFAGSLFGMVACSAAIDLMERLPKPVLEPLIGGVYGGAICGAGLGIVLATGFSTGGSDIIVRFLKYRWPNTQIGTISICFDMGVAALTGLAFHDLSRFLYSGIAIGISGFVIDAAVYRFDYSKIAIIISKEYEAIAAAVFEELGRGATFIRGEGSYSRQETNVILTAVKRHQLAELKQLVIRIDPDAFIIVQEAHQVLGDGFSRYSEDAL